MGQVKKCRSKKHNFGGCGNPRCPEGLSIKMALEEAVENHDLNSFLAAREMQDVEPSYLSLTRGVAKMIFSKEDKYATFQVVVKRPAVMEYIQSVDKTNLKSFESISDMERYLNGIYRPYARVSLRDYTEDNQWGKPPSGFDLKRLSVANLEVDADVRGQGVGRHIRATILKFADEHNYVVTGTPTESGDGTVEHTDRNDAEYKAHCIAHRERLVKFYLDTGYEYNYAVHNWGQKDYLTGEPFPEDKEWEKKLHPAAAEFLRKSGSYIRWPNNTIPDNWKASAAVPTSS